MVRDTKLTPKEQQDRQTSSTGATEDVVVKGRPVQPPADTPQAGSTREAHQRHRDALDAERKKLAQTPAKAVNTSDAKIVPTIGQPRAQTSEEIRQDQEDQGRAGSVAKAFPYPGDPTEGHVRALALAERQRTAPEFDTSDLSGTTVDGQGKTDCVKVRLLVDWWDGQGVRHPLNTQVEMPMNDARNLIDQRKAERTDPLR